MESKTKKKIIAALGVLTGGLSGATIAGYMGLYDKIFPRCERPDYDLKPGLYCYDRIKDSIKRDEIWFDSDKIRLKGYYYKSKVGKGLVVVCHGMKSGADDYIPIIKYLVENGFNVFSFDYKGTYDSEGDSTIGMCESLVDLDHALDFIQADAEFKNQPLFLLGHSWGGYAVTSILGLKSGIKGVAAISPMNDGFKIILEKGEQYAGKAGLAPKPFLDIYQKYLFRKYTEHNGFKGVNSTDIPVLIAHGVDDKVITFADQSVISYRDEITNPNVKYYIGKGFQGDHDDIWHSNESIIYRKEIESELKLLEIDLNRKLTDEEIKDYYKNNVNHLKYSDVNKELMDQIIEMFNNAL